jgi:hypothetical protein
MSVIVVVPFSIEPGTGLAFSISKCLEKNNKLIS